MFHNVLADHFLLLLSWFGLWLRRRDVNDRLVVKSGELFLCVETVFFEGDCREEEASWGLENAMGVEAAEGSGGCGGGGGVVIV